MPLAVKAEDLDDGALQPEHTIKQEAGAVKQEPLTATEEEDSKPSLAKAEPTVPMKAELKAEPLEEVKEEAGVNIEEPGAQPSDEQLAARLQALLQRADMSVVTGEPMSLCQRADLSQASRSLQSSCVACCCCTSDLPAASFTTETAGGRVGWLLVTTAAVQAGLTHSFLCTRSVGAHDGKPWPCSIGLSSARFAWLQLSSQAQSPGSSNTKLTPAAACPAERQLRKQLEQEFGCELSGRKAAIRAEVSVAAVALMRQLSWADRGTAALHSEPATGVLSMRSYYVGGCVPAAVASIAAQVAHIHHG